ncbi:chromate resistance protein ChrB domain-containing protein [Mucilaginibacter terrae]|uniref:AraC-like DNA-binding protein n=1 Tax=Mucilaginibacter terrae TaxID=1955052 RepID=A0ABU3H106_9SPHI|nr:chromate resistance protein ChrB domain-containing protein [Mucilaginibacter terrae]MDT3405610.1 AraC-like DNA-binding protein [Mucilaginibacter terrae]
MKWITREYPKIDRIATPWLIKRFVDVDAEFIYVPAREVKQKAVELDATPFDVPDVELSHHNDLCTFDAVIQKYNLKDEALRIMAAIIRGADTDAHHLAPQAAGLWAISAGLAYNIKNDHGLLTQGMIIYDALYSWAKHLQGVRHTNNPIDQLLLNVYNNYLKEQKAAKVPGWVTEIKDFIQDQLDINLTLSLSDVSNQLNVHPAYLSREFSKYFDNQTFGDYVRKMRIEKAISFLQSTSYSLSEIAYLTGFSDQSHFTRIFKKYTGQSPSIYRKMLKKSKTDTKG